ncbi:MAG TPA: phospholipase D family protein [Solirubrobacteraceae bacterium]|jgi:phosphatidylserine/phosphatidylglycerophosphate/cardiolipin synthase-like enzyme|nr:phospholipase D family protein [Solirubrobacteraceae bacterium]
MGNALVGRLDELLGDGLEAAVAFKHRRRLTKLGWARVFAPSSPGVFAHGDPPPREGCELEVLIDGANALPEIADAIAAAKQFVHITGWHLEPAFELVRGRPHGAIGVLLAEMAEHVDVRVLVWSGAPVPLFHPTRSEVSEALENLTRHTRIQAKGDPKEHPFHCHHEKTVVIDGQVAFVGGIDMTNSAGDRYDVQAHHARRSIGWHDVGTRLRGPAVADVNDHFRTRWLELTGEQLPALPAPEPAGDSTVQVVRTVEEDMYDAIPRGDFRIFESYARALHSARELIYLENQFLWSPELVSIIADKLRHPPTPQFRVVVLLPAKANNGAEDTRGQVSRLIDADARGDGAKRFLAATIRALSPTQDRADPVYVHAKVAVIDDRWLIVGSANLNAHSLFNDTEMCVVTDDAALARDTRVRLWAEHLELDEADVRAAEPGTLVDERWHPIADEQLERQRADLPATHRLLELPGASRRSARLLGPLNGLFADG